MKKTVIQITLFILVLFSLDCNSKSSNNNIILLKTKFGKIKILLYNETPLHRDNFIKLVSEGYYDNLIFHRVIKDFMIQGGDPDSKNSGEGEILGNGGPGYTIPAEFNKNLIHKKGALAAARTADDINPEKKSSGSQFYIVQGKTFTDEDLNSLEKNINLSTLNNLINKYFKIEQKKILSENKNPDYSIVLETAKKLAQEEYNTLEPITFTNTQRITYKTIGGTPHLDRSYTVFGEVIEGLEIIDKIAAVKTNKYDRPLEDIKMTMKILK